MYEIFEKLCKGKRIHRKQGFKETGIATSALTSWKKISKKQKPPHLRGGFSKLKRRL